MIKKLSRGQIQIIAALISAAAIIIAAFIGRPGTVEDPPSPPVGPTAEQLETCREVRQTARNLIQQLEQKLQVTEAGNQKARILIPLGKIEDLLIENSEDEYIIRNLESIKALFEEARNVL